MENILAQREPETNVGQTERWVSLIAGGALVAYGVSRHTMGSLGLAALGGILLHRGATGYCHMYKSLGMHTDTGRGRDRGVPYELGIRVDKSVTINKPRAEIYRFWRDFSNLSRFMQHIESVQELDARRSRWVARAPLGMHVEWEAEIVNDIPNEVIGWQTIAGKSQVDSGGSVRFEDASGGRACRVRVSLQYNPPAGDLGAAVAKLLGEDPASQIDEDLRRLKQLLETGELTLAGVSSGREADSRPAFAGSGSRKGGNQRWRDAVQESSEESFPASDAPSWTPEAL